MEVGSSQSPPLGAAEEPRRPPPALTGRQCRQEEWAGTAHARLPASTRLRLWSETSPGLGPDWSFLCDPQAEASPSREMEVQDTLRGHQVLFCHRGLDPNFQSAVGLSGAEAVSPVL